MKRSYLAQFFGLLVFLPCFALAAESTASIQGPANTSSVESKEKNEEALTENLFAEFFGTFHGPVVNQFSSPHSVNNKGQVSSRNSIFLDSELTTAYLLDRKSLIGLGPVIPFWVTPVFGQGLTLGDVGLKAIDKKTVDTGNLRIATNLYFQLPTSQYSSQVRRINYEIKTTPYWWYHFQGTRLTVGSWNEAKTYVGAADYTFKLYTEPYINYRLTPKLALNLAYELEAHHLVGKSTLDFNNYQTDLQPGLIWNVTRDVLINPYLQLFTGNQVTPDSMALCAIVSARLL